MIVVLIGVSGAGKSTLGTALAKRMGWRFFDGDDFHTEANVRKMAGGEPLTDEDRWPWLDRLNALLRETEARGESAVLACSALREAYRRRLTQGLGAPRIVFLHADQALIEARLAQRQHRYMPASLLESQFAALEPPSKAIEIDVTANVASCIAAIERALGAG